MKVLVILCGGVGTRLWPLSRENIPKQYLKLNNNQSLFQLSILRGFDALNPDKIICICNHQHLNLIQQDIKDLNNFQISNKVIIVLEPEGKNTAPAICIATYLCQKNDIMLVLSSDHFWDNLHFNNAVSDAINYIDDGIVVIGINPTEPHTGYGYIEYNENNVIKFVEKPNLLTAQEYFESGKYLWNSGIFIFQCEIMSNELEKYCNDIYLQIGDIMKNILQEKIIKISIDKFKSIRNESIDYAVMENHTNGKVVKYNGLWSDIGSFDSLFNIYNDDFIPYDSNDCLVINKEDKLITTLGVNNLMIVNTPDTLLITNKQSCQKVKQLVEEIKKTPYNNTLIDCGKFHRPWGFYETIYGTDISGIKVKKITVYPNKRLSLQSHEYRSEHWVIVQGYAKVTLGDELIKCKKHAHIYVPKHVLHRIENIGSNNLIFIETQIGDYLGEDDIVRIEDVYGR